MKFQHRHFEAIADLINDGRKNRPDIDWDYVTEKFVRMFQDDNPRFSELRFRTASNSVEMLRHKREVQDFLESLHEKES